jgi:phage terminase large subunit-like protein
MTALLDRPAAEIRALRDIATPEQRARIDRGIQAALRDWRIQARKEQLPPEGDWLIWLLITGRRWGKTRTAAEWLRTRALATVGAYAICAPTYADARDVCVEQGTRERPSGFLSVCREGEVENYNRSLGEIRMANGSRVKMLSADEPERARGWGFHAAWCDEFSSWRRPATWHETLLPAVSMDDTHRFVITTTPKRNELTRMMLRRAEADPAAVRLVRGHTLENAANLGAGVVEELRSSMGARLARQELEGELLEDVDGALWTQALIDAWTVEEFPDLDRLVIAVDPAVTSGENADDTGVVVAGRTGSLGYVLEDHTCHLAPQDAMAHVVRLYRELSVDAVIVETNNGGDYIPALLHTIDPSVKVQTVRASRGKLTRAEPIAGLTENGRLRFVGGEGLRSLFDQMTTYVPGESSPDRLDAFVWAVTALFPELDAGEGRKLGFRGAA